MDLRWAHLDSLWVETKNKWLTYGKPAPSGILCLPRGAEPSGRFSGMARYAAPNWRAATGRGALYRTGGAHCVMVATYLRCPEERNYLWAGGYAAMAQQRRPHLHDETPGELWTR